MGLFPFHRLCAIRRASLLRIPGTYGEKPIRKRRSVGCRSRASGKPDSDGRHLQLRLGSLYRNQQMGIALCGYLHLDECCTPLQAGELPRRTNFVGRYAGSNLQPASVERRQSSRRSHCAGDCVGAGESRSQLYAFGNHGQSAGRQPTRPRTSCRSIFAGPIPQRSGEIQLTKGPDRSGPFCHPPAASRG